MRKNKQIMDNIFSGTDETEMDFKTQLFTNNPPQELMKHTQREDVPWGSQVSMWMLDYYLKTGKMEKADFYEKAGYSKYYYPDEVKSSEKPMEDVDAEQESEDEKKS